ncbi:hypothetical protein [Micromonospora chersina]|uniref:hypothetical protein n=1 Tax=Micromonospora chersina TaxID=47854 RepID=UPI003723CB16
MASGRLAVMSHTQRATASAVRPGRVLPATTPILIIDGRGRGDARRRASGPVRLPGEVPDQRHEAGQPAAKPPPAIASPAATSSPRLTTAAARAAQLVRTARSARGRPARSPARNCG